jgi:hypothetical protein
MVLFFVGSNFFIQQMGKRLMEIAKKEGIQAQEVCAVHSPEFIVFKPKEVIRNRQTT